MPLRIFDRFILIITAIIMLALALLLFVMVWEVLPYDIAQDYLNRIYDVEANLWLITGIGALITLLAIGMFFIGFSSRNRKVPAYVNISSNEGGTLKIAYNTLRELICNQVLMVNGVTNAKAKISKKDNNTKLTIKVSITENIVITEVSETINTETKSNIEKLTGLSISDIDLIIDNK